MNRFVLVLLSVFFSFPLFMAQAQDGGDELEALYDSLDSQDETQKEEPIRSTKRSGIGSEDVSWEQLTKLAPFSDVAVINRKFLPKTKRFEFNASGMFGLNNRFFNNVGAALRGAYFFTEKWGVEASYSFLTDAEKDVTRDLREGVSIETESLVVPRSHMALNLKWAPIYGKMAVFDKKIVSYDMIFSLGYGMTETALESGVGALGFGVGQLYAINKGMAFRWDVIWNQYTAKSLSRDSNDNTVETQTANNDLFLSVGVSYYFPEAGYR
jgi:outer membrane beta-barrel protein